MTSNFEFVEYVCGQLVAAGEISYRKMFGSYGIYLDGKFIALICYDQLYLKPTVAGKAFLGNPIAEPPFDGAKDWYIVEELDDSRFLTDLVMATWEELPFLRSKSRKKVKVNS